MKVGVPKETANGERRVALVPDLVSKLDGIDVAPEDPTALAARQQVAQSVDNGNIEALDHFGTR